MSIRIGFDIIKELSPVVLFPTIKPSRQKCSYLFGCFFRFEILYGEWRQFQLTAKIQKKCN